jgi:hypothetical protein
MQEACSISKGSGSKSNLKVSGGRDFRLDERDAVEGVATVG